MDEEESLSLVLKATRYSAEYNYLDITVNGKEKYIKILPQGVNSLLINLGIIDVPEDRYDIESTTRPNGSKLFQVTDLFFDNTFVLTPDAYWEFLNSNINGLQLTPANLLMVLTSDRLGKDSNNYQEIYLVSGDVFEGLTVSQIQDRVSGLLYGSPSETPKGEFTSSLSKPTNDLNRASLAFFRKLALLTNSDSTKDLGTFKELLSLIRKVETFDHYQAYLEYSLTETYVNTMRNLIGDQEVSKYDSQLKGLKQLFFSEDVPIKAPRKSKNKALKGIIDKKSPSVPIYDNSKINPLLEDTLKSNNKETSKKAILDEACERYFNNDHVTDIIKDLGISSRTLYEELHRRGINREN